jgi:hypothetical protein
MVLPWQCPDYPKNEKVAEKAQEAPASAAVTRLVIIH